MATGASAQVPLLLSQRALDGMEGHNLGEEGMPIIAVRGAREICERCPAPGWRTGQQNTNSR